MPDPRDVLLCDLRELIDTLKTAFGESQATVQATDPIVRFFDNAPSGELAGDNTKRTGLIVHNASDGTLLLRIGGDVDVTPASYTIAVGPGEHFDTRGRLAAELPKQRVRYAWVTAQTDLSDFPAGVFAEATGGAVAVTTLKR